MKISIMDSGLPVLNSSPLTTLRKKNAQSNLFFFLYTFHLHVKNVYENVPHDISKILLKVALNTINQTINS